ncbi:MAG: PH domain-containing protein [Candidatus Peribacteria bacterium]|nr:MAG: PH domain-containing protein [Candidatus Peribacteria bacterium]
MTNNRIIGVEQISFLNRKVTECNLGQVQEVNSETKGFFANVLNYGTIYIQTAGSSANLKMDFAPDPLQSSRKVLNIVDDYRDTHNSMASFKREELSE